MWTEYPNDNELKPKNFCTAFDQSSLCKFSCQMEFRPDVLLLTVITEEEIKDRIREKTKHHWKFENDALNIYIDIDHVMYVKVHRCMATIFCNSVIQSSIVLNFDFNSAAKFFFNRYITHYECIQLMNRDEYEQVTSQLNFEHYKTLFHVRGQTLPVYYINADLDEGSVVKLNGHIRRDMLNDYERLLSSVKLLVKERTNGRANIDDFDNLINLYTRIRFNYKI